MAVPIDLAEQWSAMLKLWRNGRAMCVGMYREAQRALAAEKEWKERALKLEQQNKVLQQTLENQKQEENSKQKGSEWKQRVLQWSEKALEYEERNQSLQQRLENQAQEHERMKTELADFKRLLQKAREELKALVKKTEIDKRPKVEYQKGMDEQVVALKEFDKNEEDATSSGPTGEKLLKPPTKILSDDTQATTESALEFTEFYVPNNSKCIYSLKSRFRIPKPKEVICLPVVRKKAEREAMKGFPCSQCEAWYNEVKDTVDDAELLGRNLCDHVSRHRRNFDIPKSPEGFWDISFSNDEAS
eukprot:jgi/Bigna1/66217/fgenesh1_pg.1_\